MSHFIQEGLFLNNGKLFGSKSFQIHCTPLTYSNILAIWRHLFSNQMIFAAGTLSFCCPCHRKKGLKTKTDGWGGSWTDTLGLSSAPRGTIRSTSALQSAAWLANRLFSHSHYGIIGVVVTGHQQYFSRSGLRQFYGAYQHWKLALKQGTYTSCESQFRQYFDLPVEWNGLGFHYRKGCVSFKDMMPNRLNLTTNLRPNLSIFNIN